MEASEDHIYARSKFEDRINEIFQGLLTVEIESFVRNVSARSLSRFTNELLAFTMQGQQFLCVNTVCLSLYSSAL